VNEEALKQREARYVHCCECARGGNGKDPDKCACGGHRKNHTNDYGCYIGTRISKERP
jgi:hypothetical protein